MSFTIHTPDALRTIIELTTGGKQTVIYTQNGTPCVMNIIPRFNVQDIEPLLGTGTHPAFIVDGKEKSEIFIGTYGASLSDQNDLTSFPNSVPLVNKSYNEYLSLIQNNGKGFHILTNAERAAIILWSWKNKTQPKGNTNYGRDAFNTHESGLRLDRHNAGLADTGGIILTGTGSLESWRHDGTPFGLCDLCGNVNEFITGVRLVDGEIQIIENNNAAIYSNLSNSNNWKAIDKSGNLTYQSSSSSLKYDSTVAGNTEDCADPILSTVISNFNGAEGDSSDISLGYTSVPFQELLISPNVNGAVDLTLVKALCLFPFTNIGLNGNVLQVKNYGTRYATFGGSYLDGYPSAGIFKLSILASENLSSTINGTRIAFIN
jgi:hypothetical protein